MSKVECIYCLEKIKEDCLVSHFISDIDEKTFCQKKFSQQHLHIICERDYINRKKFILVDKLKTIKECSSKKDNTSAVDKKINNLQSLLDERPLAIETRRKELQCEIDKIKQKLQKKEKELEELTLENDSYSKYLESLIAQRKEERQNILNTTKKTKEQITIEYKIQKFDEELEKLMSDVKKSLMNVDQDRNNISL